ncbi:winged helix-turn-helix domain-containing protein [Shigella sonnei]
MPLTSGELAVLKALVSHPREPLSRDKLMNLARGREYSAMERSIDVQFRVCAAWWKRSGASALHSDRLGSGLRLCTGRF